jgi:hypothetical protein
MDDFRKAQEHYVDIGGRKCPCCNRLFGKKRKKLSRLARRLLQRLLRKEIQTNKDTEE